MNQPPSSLARRGLTFALVWLALAPLLHAADRYLRVEWRQVTFEGDGPRLPMRSFAPGELGVAGPVAEPYVILDGEGEVFLHFTSSEPWWFTGGEVESISIRTSAVDPIRGRVFVPDQDTHTIRGYRFEIPTAAEKPDGAANFHADEEAHCVRMLNRNLPGAAWFRFRRDEARRALGTPIADEVNRAFGRPVADPLDLFSGSRAVAENLDLDRTLRATPAEEATVPVDSISGVTTRAMDWKSMVKGLKPELDPLAKYVPGDQHAVFFPSFGALTQVLDEVDARGTQLLDYFGASTEDHGTKDRYQRQMCLPFSTLGRLLGPQVVSAVALTGSDPFVLGGSDVVLLFECKEPAILEAFLGARHKEALQNGATRVEGEVPGARYTGVVTPDRTVSSYVARYGETLVVTNSFPALTRVAVTAVDSTKSMLAVDEYVWFRDRYRRGEDGESALLVLPDAAIRRWAGPRSRIGDARRLRAAAVMADVQARHVDALMAGSLTPGSSAAAPNVAASADFVWTRHGVHSPVWGNLGFLTPISELSVDRVTPSEKVAYENFRDTFQQRWRVFDPIAVRFSARADRLDVDATIQPLVLDSEYGELRRWTAGAEIAPTAGDPHVGSLFHVVTALSKTNELSGMLREMTGPTSSSFGPDPLSWLGSSLALYGENDPWWDPIREARDWSEADDVDWYSIPIALRIEVKDPLRLAAFLTAARAFAENSAPNLTKWENRTWKDVTYVRVSADESVLPQEAGREAALYYVPFPDALVLSLREDLIRAAIDRHAERKADPQVRAALPTWLGKSASIRFDRAAVELLDGFVDAREVAAWSALPILDEWKRMFPTEDPVAVHERLWGVRLVSPGGGRFEWNEEIQAMESSEYGRPGTRARSTRAPRGVAGISSAELGLTFEGEGLRARASLIRAK